jgi:hypothetical protein
MYYDILSDRTERPAADEAGKEFARETFAHNPGGELRPRGFFYLDSL